MNNLQNSNPFLTMGRLRTAINEVSSYGVMTVQSTVQKIVFLLGLVFLSAGLNWTLFLCGYQTASHALTFLGLCFGLIIALYISFRPHAAKLGSMCYAICEGLFLSGVSMAAESRFPGITIISIGLTFGTLSGMLLLYLFDMIRVSDTMRSVITAATFGIAITYGVSLIFNLFGIHIGFINTSSVGSIIFSLIVVGVAALNLVLDFDMIERGEESELPKQMEWYFSFALLVTMVWLYLEILRLAIKLRDRR